MEKNITEFFQQYVQSKSIFKDRNVLLSTYEPKSIFHREEQINQIATILAPTLKNQKPSNIFIYGKTGTGKTLSTTSVLNNLFNVAQQQNVPLKVVYINCKMRKISDTEYRIMAHISRALGQEVPPTGLPTEEVYNLFYKIIDSRPQTIILVLDEVDNLVERIGDEILYNLTRINTELKKSRISIVGISNNVTFADNIDPRVKSSLSEEEIIYPPYNAEQLRTILKERASEAFFEECIGSGVIEKCAALAARDHGDARRAIELLRVAGELADRDSNKKLEIKYLDNAEEKIEKDKILEIISIQPAQYLVALQAIITISENKKQPFFTGEVYALYQALCKTTGLRPLTQRRVSDIISEYDILGIINANTISKGRYGRTREITLSLADSLREKAKAIIKKELEI